MIDMDAVAAFYADGTFKYRAWNGNLDELKVNKRAVTVSTFHVQNAGNQPNVVVHTGHDIYALKDSPQGFFVREGDFAPGEALKEKFFKKGASDQSTDDIGKPAAAAGGGARVELRTMDDNDPNYTVLQGRAVTKGLELRLLAPPIDGTY
jgi:hypothetical protein